MTSERLRVARYIGAGLLNTAFGYACYAAFVLASAPLWLAVAGSTTMALLFNFLSYGGLVFGDISRNRIPRFIVLYGLLGGLNHLMLQIMVVFGLGLLVAQALLLPALMVFGFAGMKGFVFR